MGMDENYQEWETLAPRGLAMIGFGLSVTGEAISAKVKGKPFWRWFLVGTVGLCLVNWGISIFGEAVKRRALYDLRDGGDGGAA